MRKMSSSGCGSPVGGGGFVRQRHSAGYASSGDDLDDDATSRFSLASPPPPRTRTWTEVVEYILWIASAAFIVYFGDQHSNLIYLLWHDGRIKRIPLYLGMVAVGLNIVIFLYTSVIAWGSRRFDEKWELVSISTLPYVTLLGIIAFCLLSFAVWPIWSFLALPLLFTLFMACMVVFPCIMISILRPQTDVLRVD